MSFHGYEAALVQSALHYTDHDLRLQQQLRLDYRVSFSLLSPSLDKSTHQQVTALLPALPRLRQISSSPKRQSPSFSRALRRGTFINMFKLHMAENQCFNKQFHMIVVIKGATSCDALVQGRVAFRVKLHPPSLSGGH